MTTASDGESIDFRMGLKDSVAVRFTRYARHRNGGFEAGVLGQLFDAGELSPLSKELLRVCDVCLTHSDEVYLIERTVNRSIHIYLAS